MTEQLVEIRKDITNGSVLPPVHAAEAQTPTPVVPDRSFFNPKHAPERESPIDAETGLPYLVMPVYVTPKHEDHTKITYHHLYYYRTDKHLGGGSNGTPETMPMSIVAGMAVRVSVGTYLMRSTHERLHQRFGTGPSRPTSINSKFEQAIKSAVGITPRKVLDVTRPTGKELVSVDSHVFDLIASRHHSGIEKYQHPNGLDRSTRILSSFFLRYAVYKKYIQADEGLIEQILGTDDPVKKCELAYEPLFEGLEMAIEPMLPRLKEWRKEGLTQPGRKDPITELRKLTAAKRVLHILPMLDERLREAA